MTPEDRGRLAALQLSVSLLYTYAGSSSPELKKAIDDCKEILADILETVENDPKRSSSSEFVKGMRSVIAHLGAVE